MKKLTYLLLLLLLTACTEQAADKRFQFKKDYSGAFLKDCIPDHHCKTEIDHNANIRLDQGDDPSRVNPVYTGDKLVFNFEMEFNEDPLLGDDEVLDRVQFEIDKSAKSFYYKDEDLQKAAALFTRIAFSMEQGFYPINKGLLEGHQNPDGSWSVFIYFHIITKGNIPVTVERAVLLEF